ncbi:helix-turn-helix domain-containing protein [Brevibacillus brevis]|uniref:Helix-turn-helix domain-containing protein n=1 Tax=Brevibacillus brevis TaxID=1393 RepID=A0ABY9TEC7_BREBE|nr:helix-turn-helix domain-containing protein [Brevibacillus brevis]WNC17547.1 helix-turn-helix domain-containing protein [Brevibacillus brevis]
MQNLEPLHTFLNAALVQQTPYRIWIGHPDSLVLCYSNGPGKQEQPPKLRRDSLNHPYSFWQADKDAIFAADVDLDYQIVICLADTDTALLSEAEQSHLYLLCSGLYHEEIQKPLKRDLEKMIDSMHMLTSTLDLSDLLQKILQLALNVIPAGDAGVFRLYDSNSDLLTPLAIVGLPDAYLHYKTKPGENVSGKVYVDGTPRIYNTTEEMRSDHTHLSLENEEFVRNSRFAKAMIVVPVLLGESCIGTLAVLQFAKSKNFTERDLKLLQGFSSQVAIAYHNATLYKEARTHLDEATQLSSALHEKNQLLAKRISVHETLTQLSLKNKGINQLIAAINRMLDRPVAYVDFLDTGIYPGKSDPWPIQFDWVSAYFDHQRIEAGTASFSQQDYFLYPIVIGSVLLGCMIVRLSSPLTQMEMVTIEQSGSVLALEVVKNISMTELTYKKAHNFFTQLLEKQDPDKLLSQGLSLNFKIASCSFVAFCEIPGSFEPYEVEARIQRFLSIVNQRLSVVNKLIYGFHNKVTLLFSVQNEWEIKMVISQLMAIVNEWNQTASHFFYGGIGTAYKNMEDIAKSYEEAQKTVSFLLGRNQSGLMRYEEIGVNRFFLNQSEQEIEKFTEEIFLPLRSDQQTSNELEKTLLVYISSNRSAAATAKKLHIHINTLYQRLKRIEERLALSFDSHEDMLKIQLACHLRSSRFAEKP